MPAESIAAPTHLRAPPATLTRLLVFTAASIALHVATLASYAPSGTTAAPSGGPTEPRVLHATLSAAPESLSPDLPSAQQTQPAPPASSPEASNEPRAGTSHGAEVPLPSKWYEPSEVDVRAKPLTEPSRAYPEELNGTGIVGRVRVLLFIDERGVVRRAQILASQPEGVFDKAAVKAWEEVRFEPAQRNGAPVKSQMLLEGEYSP